jgi:hypothetical protein
VDGLLKTYRLEHRVRIVCKRQDARAAASVTEEWRQKGSAQRTEKSRK